MTVKSLSLDSAKHIAKQHGLSLDWYSRKGGFWMLARAGSRVDCAVRHTYKNSKELAALGTDAFYEHCENVACNTISAAQMDVVIARAKFAVVEAWCEENPGQKHPEYLELSIKAYCCDKQVHAYEDAIFTLRQSLEEQHGTYADHKAQFAAPALNANGHIGECTLDGEEWAGTPASDDPDGAWICDDCGARIPAKAPTLSTDESAPRSDSAVVASLVAKRVRESLTESDVQTAINAVVAGYPGSEHGCALSPVYDGGEWSYLLWAVVNGERKEQRLAASVTPLPRLLAHWRGFIQNVAAMRAPKAKEQEAMTDIQAIPAVFSVAVVARTHVKAHSGIKQVEVARLTVNHTDDSDKAEYLREAARVAVHVWTPDREDAAIHQFMSLVAATSPGAALSWDVVVTFN